MFCFFSFLKWLMFLWRAKRSTLSSAPSAPLLAQQRPQPDASVQSFSDIATAAAESASFQPPVSADAFNDNSNLLGGDSGAGLSESALPSAPLPRVNMQDLTMQSNPLFAALGGAKLEQMLPPPPSPPPQPQPLTNSASLRLDIASQSGADTNRLARVASALRDVEVRPMSSFTVTGVSCSVFSCGFLHSSSLSHCRLELFRGVSRQRYAPLQSRPIPAPLFFPSILRAGH